MKKFVVRDAWGYVLHEGDAALPSNDIKALFALAPEASLEYARGTWGWETETDWCACGDLDCRPRVRNGGEKFCERRN